MSGISGIKWETKEKQDISLVNEMTNLQRWGACTETSVESCNGAAIGKCCIPNSPYESPIAKDESRGLIVALDGYLLDTSPLLALIPKESQDNNISQAELILRAYLQRGKLAFSSLRGQFALALWDETRQTLFLVSDRSGSRNLYWTVLDGDFVFSSQLKSYLGIPNFKLALDQLGVAEYLTYGYQMADTTFFKNIRLLLPGTILICKDGKVSFVEYWVPDMGEDRQPISIDESVEQMNYLFSVAHRRCLKEGQKVGIGLSGGRDSRMIAGYLSQQPSISCITYAFDIGDGGEASTAGLVAETLQFSFKEVDVTLIDFTQTMEECTWITEGGINTCEFLKLAQSASQDVNCLFWGFAADTLSGRPVSPLLYNAKSRDDLCSLYFDVDSSAMIPNSKHEEAFNPHFYSHVKDSVYEHYKQCFSELDCEVPVNLWVLHDFRHRQRRRTLRVVDVSDNILPTRYPFLDDDVIEFLLAQPPKHKMYQRAYGEVLNRVFPELSKIRCGDLNLSARRELQLMNAIQCGRRMKRYIKRWIPRAVKPSMSSMDRLYAGALKAQLNSFCRDRLISLAEARGILKENYALNLLNDHVTRKQNSHYLLLKLMTLETFLSQMLDRKIPKQE